MKKAGMDRFSRTASRAGSAARFLALMAAVLLLLLLLSRTAAAPTATAAAAEEPGATSTTTGNGHNNSQQQQRSDDNDDAAPQQQKARIERLVAWLRAQEGGYVSSKVVHRAVSNATANTGWFATQPIRRNETLMVLPRSALLSAAHYLDRDCGGGDDDEDEEFCERARHDMCHTAWNLVRQRRAVQRGQPAHFEAYVRYLFGSDEDDDDLSEDDSKKRQGHLPSAWSAAARHLLENVVLGRELAPRLLGGGADDDDASLTDVDFMSSCRHLLDDYPDHPDLQFDWDGDDENGDRDGLRRTFREAWWAVVSRSWNEVMLPVYDMVNHRNGMWHNADQATSAHDDPGGGSKPVVVVAIRDVAAGEPLHISYNECRDSDCHGLGLHYVLPHLLKDYGFVEQHPRRWRIGFGTGGGGTEEDDDDDDEPHVVFEIDEKKGDRGDGDGDSSSSRREDDLTLTWLSSHPVPHALTLEQYSFVRGSLVRVRGRNGTVAREAARLASEHERETVLEFYGALRTALTMLLEHADPAELQVQQQQRALRSCAAGGGDDDASETCQAQYYDDLESRRRDGEEDESTAAFCSGNHDLYLGDAEYKTVDETFSHYQGIRFELGAEQKDTCLFLSEWLQTCSSFRPHYHEAVVHIPASFVDQVRRVLFLGGGDSYLLHEVLKYPSLELVMGLELDQQVVRSSFKNLGTQPQFDDGRVQWWFGDATRSLTMLPAEYWGSFDLVIVDLQTNVAETLQVTNDMTIMDAAMRLVKPVGGVLSRNEDFYPRRSVGFAKYEVDLELLDVPVLCQQSITMGSASVDFLRKEPKDHKIDTVYLNKYKNHLKDADWFNYRNNVDVEIPGCQKTVSDEQSGADLENLGQEQGFHLILEAEECSAANEPTDVIRNGLEKALEQVGLKQKSVTGSSVNENAILILMEEGYLLMTSRQKDDKYFAFDLKLWSHYEKAESIKAALLSAVGGKSSSSFRVVTGGMSGLPKNALASVSIPKPQCDQKRESEQMSASMDKAETLAALALRESMLVAHVADSAVAVFCNDSATSCESLEKLAAWGSSVIRIPGCSGNAPHEMMSCEENMLQSLQDATFKEGKIAAIVIDFGASKATGQVLLKILRNKPQKVRLVKEDYVVLSVANAKDSSQSWRSALMERFKTDIDIFSPSYRSQMIFNSTTDSLELDLFSTGNSAFFSHLRTALKNIETKTGLSGEIREVVDGKITYVPDFYPSVVSNSDDYDLETPLLQWSSQSPKQHQTIFQFQVQAPMTPLEPGEKVLVEETQDVWKGVWVAGRVVERKQNEMYVVAIDDSDHEEMEEVHRSALRRLETKSSLEERELVLIRRSGGYWSQGAVIEKSTAEEEYFRLRKFDSNGDVTTARRQDLVKRFEAADTSHLPSMSAAALREAFLKSLEAVDIQVNENDIRSFDGVVGAGSIIGAFWDSGVAIATWDGENHIEINLLTNEEDMELRNKFSQTVLGEAPFLLTASRDEMPRGFGRVVNFPSDLHDDPYWTLPDDDVEEEE